MVASTRASSGKFAASTRATSSAPTSVRASAGALPPPSPTICTSAASSSFSPSTSPSRSASKNRVASSSRSRRSASKRGRPPSMWRRARTASWRHAASDRPTAEATSGKPNPNTSRSTKTARSSGRQPLEQQQGRHRHRVRQLRRPLRVLVGVREQRLGQPLPDVGLPAYAGRAQHVDRDPGDHGGEEGLRRPRLRRGGLVAQPGLLDRVLRLGHAAEDPVGDREQEGPQLLELLGPGHPELLLETLPPGRVAQLPAELPLRLGVGEAPPLGHHAHRHLTGQQPGQPRRDPPRRLRPGAPGEDGQPGAGGRGLVVDDVEDAVRLLLDRQDGRTGRIVDVDPRDVAGAAADHGEQPLPHEVKLLVPRARPVEAAVPQHRASGRDDGVLEVVDRPRPLELLQRVLLGLDPPARAEPVQARVALRDDVGDAGRLGRGQQVVDALAAEPVGGGEEPVGLRRLGCPRGPSTGPSSGSRPPRAGPRPPPRRPRRHPARP